MRNGVLVTIISLRLALLYPFYAVFMVAREIVCHSIASGIGARVKDQISIGMQIHLCNDIVVLGNNNPNGCAVKTSCMSFSTSQDKTDVCR